MKNKNTSCGALSSAMGAMVLGLCCVVVAQTSSARDIGPGKVVVKSKLGGPILTYDIDRNGTEGILGEMTQLNDGNVLSAVETFDQETGKIIAVLSKTENQDNDLVIGIFANSTAIVMHEQVDSSGLTRPYRMVSPLSANKYTGLWKPPHFNENDIIEWAAVNQETSTTAFLDLDGTSSGDINDVFGSNVAANTFGRFVKLTQPTLEPFNFPALAIDTKTNIAVAAQAESCTFGCNPEFGLVDLVGGKASYFTGIGLGYINGIAVDSEDGIACTTTNSDGLVEFYDLKAQTGFAVNLPGGATELQAGGDVEYDAIHKLFLVGQPISTTGSGSSIQVYDPHGNLVESVNHLSFAGYIALNPKIRGGFVNSPAGLRSFTY
jgi:hypothetical protein